MDNLNIRSEDGKTVVINEYHLPENLDIKLIESIDTLGMNADKVFEMKQKIDSILNPEELVKVTAFVNVNGMSNLMASGKYGKEITMIKTLGINQCKQSYLRIYWNYFKEINDIQQKAGCKNFYQRKAQKLGIEGDFSMMHFAFDFDIHLMKDRNFKALKTQVVNRVKT
jgi:hypothetical protein